MISGLQNDWCHPDGVLAKHGRDLSTIAQMVDNTSDLAAEARRRRYPIMFLKNVLLADGRSNSVAWRGHARAKGLAEGEPGATDWGRCFVAELEPATGDFVVETFRPGGFSDTRADVLLRSAGIREVWLAGVETHAAVLATAIQATSLDYSVTVVTDCVAGTVPNLDRAARTVLGCWTTVKPRREVIRQN